MRKLISTSILGTIGSLTLLAGAAQAQMTTPSLPTDIAPPAMQSGMMQPTEVAPLTILPIRTIRFPGGYLQQDADVPGQWTEYRDDGTRNFGFEQISADENGMRLRGTDGPVELVVDLDAKTISGEWTGQAMAVMHKVIAVEMMASAKPTAMVDAPAPAPTLASPLPKDMKAARYDGGMFIRKGARKWQEVTDSGKRFTFRSLGHDATANYLFDASRDILIVLEPGARQSYIAHRGSALEPLYNLTGFDAPKTMPKPQVKPKKEVKPKQKAKKKTTKTTTTVTTVTKTTKKPKTKTKPASKPGKLTMREQTKCIAAGGYVEQAGRLGAERCTIRFADANKICTDSAQCEGTCTTDNIFEENKSTTGTCTATDNPFGCSSEVKNGVAQPGLCVD